MEGHRGPRRYGVNPRMDDEIEDLQRRIEALKAERAMALQRRAPEPIADHEVSTSEGVRRPSDPFGPHDDLLLVHNMGRTCAYCTLWADGFMASDPTRAVARDLGFATEAGQDPVTPFDGPQRHAERERVRYALAPVRSLDLHERWMTRLACPILRLDADRPLEDLCDVVVAHVLGERTEGASSHG